ncbi:MAG: permease-like cell division protein FtsX [Actinobacteria bacterium]|nr:permease-like cell division protein FtsX [Actinomycetota bacterium]MCL5069891.1 permease-like cell division protein FtsX [Actinomycetota bacterium]
MIFRPKYFFGETFSSFRKNFLIFFTAITTVAITLFIVGFFIIIVFDVQGVLGSIKSQVEIAVYLKDNISDELKTYLENEIKGWDEISQVNFVSKDQALEKFKKENEGSEILKEIQGNPLPASFELELKSPEKVEQVALRFMDKNGNYIEGVDEVIYGQNYVQKLFSITAIVGTIAFLIVVVLLLAAIVLIFNTIRLSVHARRKEIEVMKLVGATNWFVRLPFLFEGFFEGFIGSIISVVLLYFLSNYLLIRGEKAIVDTMHIKDLAILGNNNIILYVYAGLIILGGLIGIFSSGFALKRYIGV